jgi:hypothetical protein
MPATPLTGVLMTTSTTGTGPYAVGGVVTGYAALGAGDTGRQFHFIARIEGQFEAFLGTYTHGGTPTVTRDTIITNHNRNTSPINWGIGSKFLGIVLIAERTAMLDVPNVWRADQFLNGNSLYLDVDGDTGFQVTGDDQTRYMANGVEFYNLDWANRQFRIVSDDPGAAAGPGLHLTRLSASPAANDVLGFLQFTGKDSAQATVSYAFIYGAIESTAAGSASGNFRFEVLYNGASKRAAVLRGYALTLEAGVDLLTAGKTVAANNTVGAEINSTGYVIAVVNDNPCYYANRKGSDGAIIDIRRDNVNQGDIKCIGGVVSITSFVGTHYSNWHSSVYDGEHSEDPGTVVVVADGTLAGDDRLPLVRPSTGAADRKVYGVVAGRGMTNFKSAEPRSLLDIHGVGITKVRVIGPVEAGDLLETSETTGAARAQADDLVRASTLGKAVQGSPDDGTVRLVPTVLYAG